MFTSVMIDTDIVVDAARQVPEAIAFLALQRATGGIRVSTITAMDLVSGCRNALELTQLQQFAAQLTFMSVTAAASQKGYDLMQWRGTLLTRAVSMCLPVWCTAVSS